MNFAVAGLLRLHGVGVGRTNIVLYLECLIGEGPLLVNLLTVRDFGIEVHEIFQRYVFLTDFGLRASVVINILRLL